MNVVPLVSISLQQCGGVLLPRQKVLPLFITACVSTNIEIRALIHAAYCWPLGFHASIWQASAVFLSWNDGHG